MRVLHPVDGSQESLRATEHVVWLNQRCRPVHCTALYVQQPVLYIERFTPKPDVIDRLTQAEGRRATDAAVARLAAAGVAHEREIVAGEAAEEIVRLASERDYQLIVLSARGAGKLGGILLGSVANKVLQLSSVPVTLVR